MAPRDLAVILFSVLCSSTAHLLLKKGAGGVFATGAAASEPVLLRAATNGWLWGGLALHGLALLTWVYALSKTELSLAYPFIALGFVFTAIFSVLFMHETLSGLRILGMFLIVSGLLCVARG